MADILLTGATGYLGSQLARTFVQQGRLVRALVRPGSNLRRLQDIERDIELVTVKGADDSEALAAMFEDVGSDSCLVHCATSYGRKGESVSKVLEANLALPLALLNHAADAKIGHFVNTDTVLPASANAYARTKAQFREWVRHYATASGMKVSNLALEHFYGAGDDESKFPTWLVRNCLSNTARIPLSSGTQMRDFIYIDDVVSAFESVLAAELEENWNAWRVGTDSAVTVRAFAELVRDLTGSVSDLDFGAIADKDTIDAGTPFQDLADDASVNWRPSYTLRDGLTEMIRLDWHTFETR